MNEETALWAALVANPGDETLRLVYADWLQEHDAPRAAWFRSVRLWSWRISGDLPDVLNVIKPGPEAPDERLVRAVADEVDLGTVFHLLVEPFGREFVTRLRAWGAEAPLQRGRRVYRQLERLQEYAPVTLAPVETLIERLSSDDWYEQWLAIIDFGHHGPAAAEAVPALVALKFPEAWRQQYTDEDYAEDFDSGIEHPYAVAVYHTLGCIGPAAAVAAPELSSECWRSNTAYQALLKIRPDPFVVLKHIDEHDDGGTRRGLSLVEELDPTGTDALVHAVRQMPGRRRFFAAEALGYLDIKAAHALPALIETLNELGDSWDRDSAESYLSEAIERIERAIRSAPPQ